MGSHLRMSDAILRMDYDHLIKSVREIKSVTDLTIRLLPESWLD